MSFVVTFRDGSARVRDDGHIWHASGLDARDAIAAALQSPQREQASIVERDAVFDGERPLKSGTRAHTKAALESLPSAVVTEID